MPSPWTIRFTGADEGSKAVTVVGDGYALVKRLWAVRTDHEDISLMGTVYEERIMCWCQTCDPPTHVYFEFDPEIESLHVQRDSMTNVVACLRRNGVHGHCREDRTGRTYDF